MNKILQVTAYYPPHLGGQENAVHDLSLSLYKADVDVEVVTSDQGSKSGTMVEDGIKVHRLKSIEFAHMAVIWNLLPFLLKNTSKNTIVHLHVGQAYTPEIVWLASKIKKFKYILQMHIDPTPSGSLGFMLPIYKNIFLKRAMKGASIVGVLNDKHINVIKQEYAYKGKIVKLSNGINGSYFDINHRIKKIKNNSVRLLFVGRLSPQKNLIVLTQVLKSFPNVKLEVIGNGEQYDQLKHYIKTNGLTNVILHGRLERVEVIKYYCLCDALILPSLYEAQPLVLLEAMAAGIPIIGANVKGIAEHIKEVGFICEPTEAGLSEQIKAFGNANVKQLNLMSQKAKRRVIGLNWDKLINSYFSLYANIKN